MSHELRTTTEARVAPSATVGGDHDARIAAMISLLTDANEEIVESCRRALLNHGPAAEPLLRARLGSERDADRIIQRVLDDITLGTIDQRIIDHLRGDGELEQGSLLIGRLVDDGPAVERAPAMLDTLADHVQAALAEADDVYHVMVDVLVRQRRLRGADLSQADTDDVLLQGVTSHRRGLPLPLCIVWILVARRLGLPFSGFNFPGHFLLRYEREEGWLLVDPFYGGRIVPQAKCRAFLAHSRLPHADLDLFDATDRDMLLRTLRNLVMIASRLGAETLARRAGRILRAVDQPQAQRISR